MQNKNMKFGNLTPALAVMIAVTIAFSNGFPIEKLPKLIKAKVRPAFAAKNKTTTTAKKGGALQAKAQAGKIALPDNIGKLKDGEYEGVGQGFKSLIKVKVKVSHSKIEWVHLISHGDDAAYFNRAKVIMDRVVEKNSLNVDTVSGATFSSNGILLAIKNALSKASDSGSARIKKPQQKKPKKPKKPEAPDSSKLTDGIFTGIADGFPAANQKVKTTLTVEHNKMKKIEVEIINERAVDVPYIKKAKDIIEIILKKQTTKGVDTISGATFTSNGILTALTEAMNKSIAAGKNYKDGEYSANDKGFGAQIVKVTVTIAGGKISDIKVDILNKTPSDKPYIAKALLIIDKIKSKNGITGVDTITNATFTSRGIRNAVSKALKIAK